MQDVCCLLHDCLPVTIDIDSVFAFQCKCVDPDNQGKGKLTCKLPNYKGDGNCDDENNNKGCAYDGGDCCAKSVKGGTVKKDYCKKVWSWSLHSCV